MPNPSDSKSQSSHWLITLIQLYNTLSISPSGMPTHQRQSFITFLQRIISDHHRHNIADVVDPLCRLFITQYQGIPKQSQQLYLLNQLSLFVQCSNSLLSSLSNNTTSVIDANTKDTSCNISITLSKPSQHSNDLSLDESLVINTVHHLIYANNLIHEMLKRLSSMTQDVFVTNLLSVHLKRHKVLHSTAEHQQLKWELPNDFCMEGMSSGLLSKYLVKPTDLGIIQANRLKFTRLFRL